MRRAVKHCRRWHVRERRWDSLINQRPGDPSPPVGLERIPVRLKQLDPSTGVVAGLVRPLRLFLLRA